MKLVPDVSLKWKLFGYCMFLSGVIVAFNLLYTNHVVRKSSAHSHNDLKITYKRYLAFQRSVASGMTAAVDVWATSPRLQEVFAKHDEAAQRPMLTTIEKVFAQSIRPDFVMLVDKEGDVVATAGCPIDESEARSLRLLADLRQGMGVDNALLEHKRHTYLIAAEPVKKGSEVVGSVIIGRQLQKLFVEFRDQSEDSPQKQVTPTLVHNQDVTASAASEELWEPLARASRPEARENLDDGGEKVSVVTLPDGKHDLFAATINGYDGGSTGSLGSLFLTRSRYDRESKLGALLRDNLVLGGFAFLIASLVSFVISYIIARPINQFIEATADLAHGEGDLTRRIEVRSSALEMTALGENLNAIFANLQSLTSEVQSASFQVGASSAEISAASKQMLSGATDQAQRIESSTAAVTELSSSIQQVAEGAMRATKVAETESQNLKQSVARLDELSGKVSETASKITALGQSSRRIGNIVEVIRQISEQTSLLALNASIEAAHAGEQGRGFAVVADEVSQLARRVGQSAKDIEGLIGSITDQTQESVSSMAEMTKAFSSLTSGASKTNDALAQIVEVVQDTARSVHEQAVVSDEIARNMDAVQKVTHEVLSSSREAVVQGDQLHSLALKLEELVRNFRIDEAVTPQPPTRALPARAGERRRVARG